VSVGTVVTCTGSDCATVVEAAGAWGDSVAMDPQEASVAARANPKGVGLVLIMVLG